MISRASWSTWSLSGFSVRTLAEDVGYSRRHGKRGILSAETRGLVRRRRCDWAPNSYELDTDAILALPKRKGEAELRMAYTAEDLGQVRTPRRDAGLPRARPTSSPATLDQRPELDDEDAGEVLEAATSARSPGLPDWLIRAARMNERTPEELHALVLGVVRLVARREDRDHRQPGTVAKPILRVWKACERPAVGELLADVALLVAALDDGCTEDALLHARGLRLVHPKEGRGAFRGELRIEHFPNGQNLRHDVRRLLATSTWSARTSAAHRHAEGRCRCGKHRATAPASQGRGTAHVEQLLGGGLPALDLLARSAELRWSEASQALRAAIGAEHWEIWIRPVSADRRADRLVLNVPNAWYAAHIARTWGEDLVRLVGGPVWLCHGPPDDG